MENVILRPWKLEDANDMASICNSRKVWNNLRDLMPFPYTRADAIDFLEMAIAKKPLENFCIEADGKVVGNIGVVRFNDVHRKNLEIGYFIGEKYWGQGYATTGVKLMLDYAWQHFDVVRIFAGIYDFNKSSMRVLEKNGFMLEAIHKKSLFKNQKYLDEYIYAIFKPGFGV